jgi:hypothetical protein
MLYGIFPDMAILAASTFQTIVLCTQHPKKVVLPTRNQMHAFILLYHCIFVLFLQNIQTIVTTPLKMPKNGQKQ